MASSEVSEPRTAEIWHEAPATEAALAQLFTQQQQIFTQMQLQMQQQVQQQLQQIQVQVDGIKQPQQLAMPPMLWPPSFWPAQSEPQPRKAQKKTRAGRLGKRERAELKASPRPEEVIEESPRWIKIDGAEDQAEALRTVQGQVDSLAAKCQQLEEQLDAATDAKAKVEEKSLELEAKLAALEANLQSEVVKMESKLADVAATWHGKFEEKNVHLEALITSSEAETHTQLETAIADMQAKLESTTGEPQSQVEGLSASMESKLADNASVQKHWEERCRALDERCKTQEAELARSADTHTELQTAIADMQVTLERTAGELQGQVEAQAACVESKLAKAEDRCRQLEDRCQTQEAELVSSRDAHGKLQAASADLQARSAALRAEVEKMESKVEKLESKADAQGNLEPSCAQLPEQSMETARISKVKESPSPKVQTGGSGGSDTRMAPQKPPAPARDALQRAIRKKESKKALELLKLPEVPGLNDIYQQVQAWCWGGKGCSMLTLAIRCGLEDVALAVLGRPDFQQLNYVEDCGWTCLHCAAFGFRGISGWWFGISPKLCEAILARSDFRMAQARITQTPSVLGIPASSTALDVAKHRKKQQLVEQLEAKLRA
mmetsp:Transcript_79554/g.140407  ORF Transcript_79554/g.140407 Transcript_79554/m.140407 type:complete len:610 (+) Transcript_79554:130-1959(+)